MVWAREAGFDIASSAREREKKFLSCYLYVW